MSKVVNKNYTDADPDGAYYLKVQLLTFGHDYAKTKDVAGEAIITNLTSPTDCPETLRFSTSAIADIYKNSGITPEFRSPSKRGFTLLCQNRAVYTVTDTLDPSYRVDLPIEAHIVIKAPSDANITSDMLVYLLGRTVSGFYNLGGTVRIPAMARGSLLPTDM